MTSYRRTNSLAFAKADCHTCADLKRWCDRQRPQCGTCAKHRRKCGGYVLDLTWKNHSGNEASSPARSAIFTEAPTSPSPGRVAASERQFKFKQGRPKKKRKAKGSVDKGTSVIDSPHAPSQSLSSGAMTFSTPRPNPESELVEEPIVLHSVQKADAEDTWLQAEESVSEVQSHPATFPLQNWPSTPSWMANDERLWPDPFEAAESFSGLMPGSFFPDSLDHFESSFPFNNGSVTDTSSSTGSPDSEIVSGIYCSSENGQPDLSLQLSRSSRNQLSPGVLYNDTHHKFSPVLSLYDEEFCVIPLTMDCVANPFRVRPESVQASQYLLHAILALSMQHLAKKSHDETLAAEMQVHRSTATHLYSEALSKSDALALLDTLLILVNVDITQSASGTWDVHLLGALKLLESAGGVEVCKQNPRRRAQIAMLVWWDVTVAFISRQEPLFPLGYLETLLECNSDDGWTFFSLNGCPGEFVYAMARLAKLASTYEKVASLNCEWTTFNLLPVDLIVEEVKSWKNEDDRSFQDLRDVGDIDAKRDRFHCSEAWRYSIILYTLRVFTERQDQHGLQSVSFLSRIILDHIRCIKQAELTQKQVLIPILLAAAESGDESDRAFTRHYCMNWSSRSRYFMFETAQMILERIWAGWDVQTRDVYWWGVMIRGGSWSRDRQNHPMANQFLLG